MKKSLTFCCLSLLIYACQNTEDPSSSAALIDEGLSETSEIYVNSGFLVFQSNSILQETMQSFESISDQEKIEWSFNYPGFKSMLNLYNQAMNSDAVLGQNIKNDIKNGLSVWQNAQINETQTIHSEFVNDNLKYFHLTEDGQIDMNIFRYDMAHLVNIDGLVQVGNYLFQYSKDYLKIIENPKNTDIALILNQNETSYENGITVHKVNHEFSTQTNANSRTNFNAQCTSIRVFQPNGDAELQENTVELNVTTYPVWGTFPCGHPYCFEGCFRNSCEAIIGYETHQTFQIRSWGRIKICIPSPFGGKLFCFKLNNSLTHTQYGSYYINGAPRTHWFKSQSPSIFANETLYSGPTGNITNANLFMEACGKTNCNDWENCNISF